MTEQNDHIAQEAKTEVLQGEMIAIEPSFKPADSITGDFVMNALVWLVVLLVSCFLLLKLFKKKLLSPYTDSKQKINVIETKRLSSKTVSYLVSVNGRSVFILESSANTKTCTFNIPDGCSADEYIDPSGQTSSNELK